MKKISTLAILVLCFIAFGYGQENPVGGTFESWKYNTVHHYYEPDSSIFSTLNILDTIPTPSGITVYPCDTAHTGNFSAGLITGLIDLSPLLIKIPGVIGTIKINWTYERAILGIPYPYGTTKPIRFSGYYQSYPILNDSSAAVILLSKWNHGTHHRDTLAYNRLAFHGIVNTWTAFDTAVNYIDPVTNPDTLTILLLSCGGFNAANMFGSVGQVGSKALFDDVIITGVNGFPLLLMPSVNVKLSPNPASQIMKIELGSSIENGYFEIYDGQAKLIRKVPVSGTSEQIRVNDLSSGMYYYKLTESTKLLNSGTFIVTR
jgi:hypothetical protein